MQTILENNRLLVEEINRMWQKSEDLRKEFFKSREESAMALERLTDLITDKAREQYGKTVNIRQEPIVENNELIGMKAWINDHCQILSLKKD